METAKSKMSAVGLKRIFETPPSVSRIAALLLTATRRSRESKPNWVLRGTSDHNARRHRAHSTAATGLWCLIVIGLTPILMGRWLTTLGILQSEVVRAQASHTQEEAAPAAKTPLQANHPAVVRTAAKPFNLEEPTVFGGIPKSIFPTQILYNVGPTFSREKALALDGLQFSDPIKMRQWRQIIFELNMNKLNPKELPNYTDFLAKARDFRWDNSHENTEPILIADVGFEWIPGSLDTNPELQKRADGTYELKQAIRAMTTNKGRFFGASLLPDAVHSPLVTFVLSDKFVYSNRDDAILSATLSIENNTFSVAMNGSRVVDLGEKEGDKTVYLTAHHRSGEQSKMCFTFALERVNGRWVNSKAQNGKLIFEVKQLPTITFTQKDNQRLP